MSQHTQSRKSSSSEPERVYSIQCYVRLWSSVHSIALNVFYHSIIVLFLSLSSNYTNPSSHFILHMLSCICVIASGINVADSLSTMSEASGNIAYPPPTLKERHMESLTDAIEEWSLADRAIAGQWFGVALMLVASGI
jgi:hypothetical protein